MPPRLPIAVAVAALPVLAVAEGADPATYANPLPVAGPAGPVESCADPTVEALPGGAGWVMLCTTDPLSGADRDASGDLRFRLLPTFTSPDLVRWTYRGDAFDRAPGGAAPPPAWADPTAVLWAPEIDRLGGRWVLTFAVTDATEAGGGEPGCDEDSAIGIAVADDPLGPWMAQDAPLVAPRRAGEGCEFFWTLDPEVVETDDGLVIYHGSFHGGLHARALVQRADGRWWAPEATEVPIALPGRYEGAEVVEHDGWFHLFASATNCCAGPQTGYAVFAGRSRSPLGPFRDRDGASFLEAGVGGTPVLAQDGGRWVGPGHNTVVQDRAGQWWTLYHAVEESAPWFAGTPGFTRRPLLLDRLDWIDGWPVVNGGRGPSADAMTAPASGEVGPPVPLAAPDRLGRHLLADAFAGAAPGPRWSWVRGPPSGAEVAGGVLSWPTQDADLWEDRDDAAVLATPLPPGDVAVQARVRLVPRPEGCCQDYVQAGLVLMAGDDAYAKLALVSIGGTLQTEFAREVPPATARATGGPRYGNTVVGPPGEGWTWLRVAVRRAPGGDVLTPWTSRDGATWRRGGAWTLDLGPSPRLGLVAMGGAGVRAEFDDVAAHRLLTPDP